MTFNKLKYIVLPLLICMQVNTAYSGNGKNYNEAVKELAAILEKYQTLNSNNFSEVKTKVDENYDKLSKIKLNSIFNFRKKRERNRINKSYYLLKKSFDFLKKVKLDSVNLDSIQLSKFKMDSIKCCSRLNISDSVSNSKNLVECMTKKMIMLNYNLITEYSNVLCINQQNSQQLTEHAINSYLPHVQKELHKIQEQINDIIRVMNNQELIILNIVYYDLKNELVRDNYIP